MPRSVFLTRRGLQCLRRKGFRELAKTAENDAGDLAALTLTDIST